MVDLALRAQFHRARAHWLGFALTRDLAWSLAFLLASALLSFHLDSRWILSASVRLGWGIATLAALFGLAAGFVARSLGHRPDNRSVALGMERRHPELRERLLSAVELGRLPESERARYSPGLLAAVQADAEAAASGLDFRQAVTWHEARPALAVSALLTAAALLHLALAPAAVAAWWGRMLHPSADIPVYRATRVRVSPREALLLRGGDLTVAVLTEGRSAERATLHFRVGGGSWSTLSLLPPFRHRLEGLTETTQFYATAGDGQSDRGVARVVDPPALVGLRLRYHFPAYMARPDQILTGVSGTLSVPVGTRVELAMMASKPLRSALLEGSGRSVPLPPRGTELSGALTLLSDTHVRVRLQDTDGFPGSAPGAIDFHAVPDTAPEIRLDQPAGDQDVVADASVPLHVAATDDYGLHRLWIAHRPERGAAAAASLPLAAGTRTQRGLDVRARWNLGALSLRPGDVLLYRAEADDFDDLRGPHTGQSDERRLRIVERAEMERRLAEGWAQWDEQLGMVIQEQAATRAALLSARRPADLADAERRQRDLAPRADDLSRGAAELAEMARTNHLAAEPTLVRQERAGQELAQIASHAMPDAADRIRATASQPAARPEAAALQADILRRLTALRRQAQPDTDLEALARRAEELARAQAEIETQAQRLLPVTLGMHLSELALAQRGSLVRISQSQSALQQTTGQFEGTLDQVARAGPEPAVAASHFMREQAVPERQGQAAAHVAGNLLARAASSQQALAGDLRQVAALLRRAPDAASSPASAAHRQAVARALRQLEQMLRQHAELMRRTAARPDAAASRRLARQERALRQQAARMGDQLRRSGVSPQSMQSAAQRMAQAERQLDQGAPRQAQSPQQQAQEAMRQMAQRLQDRLGDPQADQQREQLRRELQHLAQRQGAIGSALQRAPEPPSPARRLAPQQEAIARSAHGLQRRLPSEAFRSAMAQAEAAMGRAGAALKRGETGSSAQSPSRQAEQLLQEMARALEQQGANSPRSGQQNGQSPQSRQNQQNQRELAQRLADLRLLRQMEQGLRQETGEANARPEGREERLRDLARRQGQARDATARAAQALRRIPGAGQRVGEAAGAMGQAQRGLKGGSAGAETQGSEATAIMRLTQAMGQAQQQLQAMAARGAGAPRPGQPGSQNGPRRGGQQPALDSLDVHGSDEGGPRALVPSGRRGFGLLSPGDQQALRQGTREKVPSDYADLIRRYYRALSEHTR